MGRKHNPFYVEDVDFHLYQESLVNSEEPGMLTQMALLEMEWKVTTAWLEGK